MKRGWWNSSHMKTEGGPFEERKGPQEEYVCIDMAAGEGDEEEQRLSVYTIMRFIAFHANLKKKLIEKKSSTPSLLAVCASVEECDYNSDVKRSHREIAVRGPAGQRLPSELGSMEDSLPSSPPALIWRMSWAWMPDLSLVGPLV